MTFILDGITYKSLGSNPLNAENSYQYQLIQLLTGFTQIQKNTIIFKQREDYSTLTPIRQLKKYDNFISQHLRTFTSNDSVDFINKTRGDNREFYRELLCEFSNYFIQTKYGAHTAAFVFLYRILERVSYSAPLLYCSTQKDYIGTYNNLKSLFTSTDIGELKFFKQFINLGNFIDPIKLSICYTVNFSSQFGLQNKYYKTSTDIFKEFKNIDPSYYQVEIEFKNVCGFLINLRNRFFHYQTGASNHNIKMIDLQDSNEYFSNVNSMFCSVLALITLQTISHKYNDL